MRPSHETLAQFQERLTKARSALLAKEPFLGFLALELATLIVQSSDGNVTAATDGKRYIYNYLWCRELNDLELVFVIAHEVAHVMFLHASRREGRESHLWNAACDYAINALLMASAIGQGVLVGIATMPTKIDAFSGRRQVIGLYDERFANKPAELIYEQLLKETNEVGVNWDQLLEPQTEGEATASVTQARAAVAKALARAKEFRAHHGQGNQPGEWERWAEKELQGTVRWQDRFRSRVMGWGQDVLSWARPNPKYRPHGLYLPRYRGYQLPDIIFAFDTSGSISDRVLGRMVGELNQLLLSARNSVVRLVCCDATVHVIGDFNATRRLDPRIHTLRGGGGTDFRPVFEYAQTHQEFRYLIYFTDAYGIFPDPRPRGLATLWLLPDSSEVKVPFGDVIKLPINS